MADESRLSEIGVMRICDNCNFKSTSRQEFRSHVRQTGHTQKNRQEKKASGK